MPKREHVSRNSNSGSNVTGTSSSSRYVCRRAYLASYNAVQCGLWLHVLYHCMRMYGTTFANAGKSEGEQQDQRIAFWDDVHPPLMMAQVLSVLEVVHSIVGVVRASPLPSLAQVFGRLIHIFVGMSALPSFSSSVWPLLLLTVWCAADIPRYTLYLLLQLQGPSSPSPTATASSSPLLASLVGLYSHIRYNTFLLLYPTGFALECIIHSYAVKALTTAAPSSQWSLTLPNKYNVAFHPQYAWRCWTLVCGIGLYMLMSHMWRQRAKFYAGGASNSGATRSQRSGKPSPPLPPKKRD